MEIQSNSIAASLFDGVAQSQQTQGTAPQNDMFSKMMDRMLADAAARKREQAAAEARDNAHDAKEARDAKAAEAQRKAPVRPEPRLDPQRNRTMDAARAPDRDNDPPAGSAGKAAKADDGQAADRHDRSVRDRQDGHKDGHKLAKAEKRSAEKPSDGKAEKGGAKAGAAVAGKDADSTQQADETTATAEQPAIDETAADASDDDAASADGASAQPADGTGQQAADQVQPAVPTSPPQPSDLILAGLAPAAKLTDGDAEQGGDGTAADGQAAAGAVDPAAQMVQAQQSAQAQAAGSGAAAGTEPTSAGAKAAGEPAAKNADPAAAGQGDGAEALPDDEDAPLPDRFADLLAAAKAKAGEAKSGGNKQTAGDGGSRNDAQAQPQAQAQASSIPQPAPAAPATAPALETTAAADGKAIGALEGVDGAGSATGGTSAASPHSHPALAAMEGAQGGASALDQPQAAATLRPSRGSAGMPMGVQDQIAVHIKKHAADDVDQFTINLHPAELGRIDIKLDIGPDGRVNAMVAVEKAQTLELLQRDSRGLERALQDAGLQADSNSLNFSLRGEGNPFAGDGRGDGRGSGAGRRGRGFGGGGDDDGADVAAYTVTLGNGRLDIRA